LGLPEDWLIIEDWLCGQNRNHTWAIAPLEAKALKWPDIPLLNDYSVPADADFWKKFPSRDLPKGPETKINVEHLREKVQKWKSSMTEHQFSRASKAVEYLSCGAPSFQSEDLPACYVKNASSTFIHGSKVTECIATWVSEGYAAGPFEKPPCQRFRVNPLIAVIQPGKVRPVLDVSSPNGSSFNSNVDEYETESIKMASAKKFSQKLLDCGSMAEFSKHDLVAAYKQVPCRTEDLRLQGFSWLGRYFVETRQVFGAKTSVCNYDILGETLKMLAVFEAGIPAHLVMRQVDDVPSISPENHGFSEKFSREYKILCEHLNVELAPNCPNNDKAFENQVRGKVLGVMFDSSDLTWRLSDSKMQKTSACIGTVLSGDTCTLKNWQSMMGRINDICQMNPFMKIFRYPLNQVLEGVLSDAPRDTVLKIPAQARSELLLWSRYLSSKLIWLPIGRFDCQPPLVFKEFVSDTAGSRISRHSHKTWLQECRICGGWHNHFCTSVYLARRVRSECS
jgi:hypothetical protein